MIQSIDQENTLGYWAAKAIETHFKKFLKHEADVLEDKSPEALHQMRVGMRRLRSAIAGFAPALDLPASSGEKQVGKIARTLGMLRDLDVLHAALENDYKPILAKKERKELETALAYLDKQRRTALAEVKDTLEGDRYQSLKQTLKKWLKQPSYLAIAEIPIQQVLPDLLLPEISKLLLHPGWLVGTQVRQGEIEFSDALAPEIIQQQLVEQAAVLHDLRKATKRTRYQMEVFSDFYGTSYQAYLKDMKSIQEILGQMQDSFVLSEFMADALDSKMKNSLPTLAEQLTQKSNQAWQKWQTLQQRYLNLEIRKGFHSAILQPTWEHVSDGQRLENSLTFRM